MAQQFGFRLDISMDIDRLTRSLSQLEHESIPFWTANALTKTAQDIKTAEVEEMKRVFDRPTRFTLNALYIKPATKRDLTAAVMFKDEGGTPAWRYLGPQVESGVRSHKGFEKRLIAIGYMHPDEFVVPGKGAQLDAYGNISGGLWQRIISDLGLQRDPLQNTTAAARKRNKSKKRGRYIVLRPDWPVQPLYANLVRDIPPGIYHKASGGNAIVPVVMFVRTPNYKKRLDYYGLAKRVLQQRFGANFRLAMQKYPHRSMR